MNTPAATAKQKPRKRKTPEQWLAAAYQDGSALAFVPEALKKSLRPFSLF